MKVKVISRSAEDHTRARSNDIFKVQRNLDPNLHPFEKAREYTRALNAVKVERMMAKPFLASLSGHVDGVYCMAKHPTVLDRLYSGSADGEVRVWSLSQQKTQYKVPAHKGFVKGLCAVPGSNRFFSCGVDKTVKLWSTDADDNTDGDIMSEPVATYLSRHALSAMDHHRKKNLFATSDVCVNIWDHQRSEPVQTFEWGTHSVHAVKFNQTETSILASCADDRSIVLYDVRLKSSIAKVILELKSNALCWNPMEAFIFTAANEDHNCYTFDMRNLKHSLNVLKDHVSAVLDIDYSPTGRELVTGAYDRTLRIFDVRKGHSRDVYHTNRMQRLWCVKYSMDSKYVMSGSDDSNIRLWKAVASEKLGPLSGREKTHIDYSNALKEKFAHMPEIKRIARHRNTPKAIKSAAQLKRTMLDARKKKEDNLRKHSKEGTVKFKSERTKHIVAVEQ
ncbi:Protein sof1 [Sorochytrium milnesiophthora]